MSTVGNMNIQYITKEELKRKHFENRGFVFHSKGQPACASDDSIKMLVATLLMKDVTDQEPILVGKVDQNHIAFIWDDNCHFDSPSFFQYTMHPMIRMRFGNNFNVLTIREFVG